MDLPAAEFRVELTQPPVAVDGDRVLAMVEVHAEWWMVDAKPAESDEFWG